MFVDNFFTSLRLLYFLHDNNIKATGVIRSNKLSKCPIEAPKSLEKKERGFFDQRSDSSGKLTVVGWNDNRSVHVASDAVGANPTASVSRWCRKSNSRISVSQPYMIKMYNRHMGGVDRCDQNISTYRISIRSKNGGGHCSPGYRTWSCKTAGFYTGNTIIAEDMWKTLFYTEYAYSYQIFISRMQ